MYFTYILYSKKHDRYYVGQTNAIGQRLKRHNLGYEKYTQKFIPWELKCSVQKASRSEAMVLEKKLKNLSRSRLKQFINKYTS